MQSILPNSQHQNGHIIPYSSLGYMQHIVQQKVHALLGEHGAVGVLKVLHRRLDRVAVVGVALVDGI